MYKQLSKQLSSLTIFDKPLRELIKSHPLIRSFRPFDGFKIDKIKPNKWKTIGVSSLKFENGLKTCDGDEFELCNVDALKKALKLEKPYGFRPFKIQGKDVEGQLDVVATKSISKGTIVGFHFGKICPKQEYSLIPVADPTKSKDVTFYIPRSDVEMFNFLIQSKFILQQGVDSNPINDDIKKLTLSIIVSLADRCNIKCDFLKKLAKNSFEDSIKMLDEKMDEIREKPSNDPKYHFDFKVDENHVLAPVLDNRLFIGSGTEFINGAKNEDSVSVNVFFPGVYIQECKQRYSFVGVLAIKDINPGESILDRYTLDENYALARGYEVS